MENMNHVYFQKTHLDTVIEINDIVVMRYYEFQNDVTFDAPEVHNFWEFVYVDRGSIVAYADDNYFFLEQGEMIFHKPGQSHDLIGNRKDAANVLVGCFFCENKAMEYFEDKILTINKKNKELLSEIIRETQEAFEKQNNDIYMLEMTKKKVSMIGSQQMIKIHLEELLIRLIREQVFQLKTERSKTITRDNFETGLVEDIIQYMETNIQKNLKREDICREFMISVGSMETMFKNVTSQPTMKYFTQLKIEYAKKMIRESSYNFTQISEQLGFSTPHYFSAVFKKIVNMTPSEYASSIKAISDNN